MEGRREVTCSANSLTLLIPPPGPHPLLWKQVSWLAAPQWFCWLGRQKALMCRQPFPLSARSSCFAPGRVSCSSGTDNRQWLGPGPDRTTLGSGGDAFTGMMSLWPVDLALDFCLLFGAVATPAEREKEISEEKRNNQSCQGRREKAGESEKLLLFEMFRHTEVMILATR